MQPFCLINHKFGCFFIFSERFSQRFFLVICLMNYLVIHNILTHALPSAALFVSAHHLQYLLYVFCVQDAKNQVLFFHFLEAAVQYQMAIQRGCRFFLLLLLGCLSYFRNFDLNNSCLYIFYLTPWLNLPSQCHCLFGYGLKPFYCTQVFTLLI